MSIIQSRNGLASPNFLDVCRDFYLAAGDSLLVLIVSLLFLCRNFVAFLPQRFGYLKGAFTLC